MIDTADPWQRPSLHCRLLGLAGFPNPASAFRLAQAVSIFQLSRLLFEQGWRHTCDSECVIQDHAARREYELMTPPSFEVQTMSFTRTVVASRGSALKSGGK